MYRPTPSLRDRAGPLVAVMLLHVALGYALLHLSGADVELARRADMAIFDVAIPPPPPPPVVEERKVEQQKPKKAEGAAAPRNIASRATPVIAPKPRIVVPAPSPIVATLTPATGATPTQGASTEVGPGTGAGGTGTGTGGGAFGLFGLLSLDLALLDHRRGRRRGRRDGNVEDCHVGAPLQLDIGSRQMD